SSIRKQTRDLFAGFELFHWRTSLASGMDKRKCIAPWIPEASPACRMEKENGRLLGPLQPKGSSANDLRQKEFSRWGGELHRRSLMAPRASLRRVSIASQHR